MTSNMRRYWDEVKSDPQKRSERSRLYSPYAQQGQPLAVWMSDPKVALSQPALAKELGVSTITVSNWISGRSTPRAKSLESLKDLVLAYGVPLDLEWVKAT